METHDSKRGYFWHPIRLRPFSLPYHRGTTNEIDAPYRTARAHVFNFFGWGIVVGKWRQTDRSEFDALMAALQARVNHEARVTVSDHATDLDDEWKLLDMLGLT